MGERLSINLETTPGAVPEARRQVRAWMRSAVSDRHRAADVELCVSELVSNAVLHAYPNGGSVEVSAGLADGPVLVLEVVDHGSGFRLSDAGMGLRIAISVSDDLIVESQDGTTRVTALFAG